MRLDVFLAEKGYYSSRNKAAEACERGEVTVNGVIRRKPSFNVSGDENVATSGVKYVSLGAYKMLRALEVFKVVCKDKVFADIGASTGGFTQCLLTSGAKKVYCVDVGENLLDKSISSDERVVVMDNTNARYLKKEDFDDELDGLTVDCSFISLKILLPVLKNIIGSGGEIIALIKPQFECGKKSLGKSGILLDGKKTVEVLKDIYDFVLSQDLAVKNFTYSPISEKKNIEFLILLDNSGDNIDFKFIEDVAKEAISLK